MKENRFIELLNSLDFGDIKILKFYIDSNIFNTNKKITLIYDIIVRYSPNRNISETILYEELCKIKKISHSNFRMLLTDFSDLIETYLVHSKLRSDEAAKLDYLLKHAYTNNMNYLLGKTLNELNSYLDTQKFLSLKEKLLKIEYESVISLLYVERLKKVQDAITGFILQAQMQSRSLSKDQKKYVPVKFTFNETDKEIRKIKKNDLSSYLFFLLSKKNELNNSEIEELKIFWEQTNSNELKCLISESIIGNSNLVLENQIEFARWYWKNAGKRNKLLNVNNVLMIALRSHDVNLCKKVVKFIEIINQSSRGYFSLALYHFYQNDFMKCLYELEKIVPDDKDENVQIRQLKMCCQARLNYIKQFNKSYYAFKKFAAANKNSEIIDESTKFCRILFQITNSKNNLDKLLQVENILAKEDIINKNWLIDELNFHFKNLAN